MINNFLNETEEDSETETGIFDKILSYFDFSKIENLKTQSTVYVESDDETTAVRSGLTKSSWTSTKADSLWHVDINLSADWYIWNGWWYDKYWEIVGRFDVYLNGEKVHSDIHDYCVDLAIWTVVEIKNIRTNTRFQYLWPSSYSYTVNSGWRVIAPPFKRIYWTVTTYAWEWIKSVSGAGSYSSWATVSIDAILEDWYSWWSRTGYQTSSVKNYSFSMPSDLISFYANATPNTNTKYTVIHQQEWLDWVYVTVLTEVLEGTTNTTVIPAVKSYQWFDSPDAEELIISGDWTKSLLASCVPYS